MDGEVDGWYFPSLDGVPRPRNLVLIGRTGTGKSATGNSILGYKAFKSGLSMSGITSNHECQTTTLTNGEVVNVIDTPDFFDVGSGLISRETVKCLDLAKDGIHALLLVLSVGASVRFSDVEADAIMSLRRIFGLKIAEYMIVVFTGGDCLEKHQSLEDLLCYGCPDSLQKILHACKNRVVLFDNITKDKKKKKSQRQKLFSLVDKVIEENGGKPYTKSLCSEIREEDVNASDGHIKQDPIELMEKMQKSHDEQLKQMMEMFESKLKETNEKFQQKLNAEKVARLNAEKIAKDVQKQTKNDSQILNDTLGALFELKLKEANAKLQQQLTEEKTARLNAEKIAKDVQKQTKNEIQILKNNLAVQFESKLKDTTDKLQKQLAEEKTARLNAEKIANDVQKQTKNEIQILNNNFAVQFESKLKDKTDKLQKQLAEEKTARLNAEKIANDVHKQTKNEIQILNNNLAVQFESKLKETSEKLQQQLTQEKAARLNSEKIMTDVQKQTKNVFQILNNSLAMQFECMLKDTSEKLQQQLTEEKAARLNAEKIANDVLKQTKNETQIIKNNLVVQFEETSEKLQQQLTEEKTARLKAEKIANDVLKQTKNETQILKNNLVAQFELKLKETSDKLQQQLTEEKATRLNVEKITTDVQNQTYDVIQKLEDSLSKAKKKLEEDVKEAQEDLLRRMEEMSQDLYQHLNEEEAARLNDQKRKDKLLKMQLSLAEAKKQSEDDRKQYKGVKSSSSNSGVYHYPPINDSVSSYYYGYI